MLVDIDRIKRSLSYNRDTGIFVWRNPPKNHSNLNGKEAGCIATSRGKSYRVIAIFRMTYKSHRLAWLFEYGVMPKCIDHINGDSLDNRINNLRIATHYQNTQNHTKGIKSNDLPTGVCTTNNGKFRSRITVNKKTISLGSHPSIDLAHDAYISARKRLHDAPAVNNNVE
jgi:hypothetical protein